MFKIMCDSVCLRGCILLFLDKDVCILYLQARVYRCSRAGGMGAMIWRVMFYEPSHLDGWTCIIPGIRPVLYDCIAGDSANSKAFQSEAFSCSQQCLNYAPEMRTTIGFCIHI
ncbi:hypothetical protein BDA96_06G175500 [Sorghum bicolor]|uniref:Uncharacterized protein n=2 Tax=Sorghum bicolor TaxID=4558 RepID=A0A921QQZ6_SORBI|nr:hypothetical protein BDA96_06G175500 [Sorghum bicolor]KXG26780.1 hypothetical protein SORBI_3006G159400 [Sorghum bicolor]